VTPLPVILPNPTRAARCLEIEPGSVAGELDCEDCTLVAATEAAKPVMR
jgi:hypothetical protein